MDQRQVGHGSAVGGQGLRTEVEGRDAEEGRLLVHEAVGGREGPLGPALAEDAPEQRDDQDQQDDPADHGGRADRPQPYEPTDQKPYELHDLDDYPEPEDKGNDLQLHPAVGGVPVGHTGSLKENALSEDASVCQKVKKSKVYRSGPPRSGGRNGPPGQGARRAGPQQGPLHRDHHLGDHGLVGRDV